MDARKKALESQLSSLPRQKPLERKPSAKPLPIPPLAHPPPVMIPASSVPGRSFPWLHPSQPIHGLFSVIPPLEVEVEDEEPDLSVDLKALEHIQTALFGQNKGPFYTYSPVPWTLEVRKEVCLNFETPCVSIVTLLPSSGVHSHGADRKPSSVELDLCSSRYGCVCDSLLAYSQRGPSEDAKHSWSVLKMS